MEKQGKDKTVLFLTLGFAAVIITAACSILFGSSRIPMEVVRDAIFHFDGSITEHQVIAELRIPRTIGDIVVGAAFAASGALMQGMTKNPLADSGLLGINSGAAFGLAVFFAFFSSLPFICILLFSYLGAGVSAAAVYGLTGLRGRKQTPVQLVLAGSAVSAFLVALSQMLAMYYNVGQDILFWTAGGTAGIRVNQLLATAPFLIIGLIGALCLSKAVSVLNIGEDTAVGLGVNISLIKGLCILMVLFLAGSSVALAGPVTFVGLIVPHIVRFFVGEDYRKVIPCSMIAGSALMLAADVFARVINRPHETPVGLIFAMIGVPFFIIISRKQRGV